jgi:glucose-6-phosphate dehydrogenase assembly protein OpcA
MGPGGHPVCSEQVVLEVTGTARERVPEAVRRLLVSDMPVFVWWRAPVVGAAPLGPHLELADRFILNSATQEDEDRALPVLAWMTEHPGWRGCVGDLAWMRTEPWREIVAAMFDDPDARSGLPGLREVQIDCAGGDGCGSPGLYLAGWLASRLGWTVERPGPGAPPRRRAGADRAAPGDLLRSRPHHAGAPAHRWRPRFRRPAGPGAKGPGCAS